MKRIFRLFFLIITTSVLIRPAVAAMDPSKLNAQISAEWERVVLQASSKRKEIEAQLQKDPSNEGLLSEEANYSIPGILLKQITVQTALISNPHSAVSPNVDGDASNVIQKEQIVIAEATRLFLIERLKEFLTANPSYGTGKGDLIPRAYLEKVVSNSSSN